MENTDEKSEVNGENMKIQEAEESDIDYKVKKISKMEIKQSRITAEPEVKKSGHPKLEILVSF